MAADPENSRKVAEPGARTLGDVLYATPPRVQVAENEWAALVVEIGAGDQRALQALYERSSRVVFTLIMRIVRNRESAEELTLDVYHDVWRRAGRYDPANGSVLGWILNQARSRAIDRHRFERRLKRVNPFDGVEPQDVAADCEELVAADEKSQAVRTALESLTADERRAVEAAYLSGLTYSEAANRLNAPVGTIKTRIRSALQKLRHALADTGRKQ